MPTITQLVEKGRKKKKSRKVNLALSRGWNHARRSYYLINSPQKSGICKKVGKRNPRKPNSALRSYARVILSNKMEVIAYIPGEGHNLQDYSNVIIEGGKVKDLPGVNFKVVRGVRDTVGVEKRRQGRSLYGRKKVNK